MKVFLQYIQRCCSRGSPVTAIHLLGRQLTDLLSVFTVVRPEVRHGAMSAVYAAMTAAVQCDEVSHSCGRVYPACTPRCTLASCARGPLLDP